MQFISPKMFSADLWLRSLCNSQFGKNINFIVSWCMLCHCSFLLNRLLVRQPFMMFFWVEKKPFLSDFSFCLKIVWCLFFFSLLNTPPSLLTSDLPDFETSVDSRCTTDSADSAFVCRRYWSLASSLSPFLSSNHQLPSPSHTGSKTAHQIPRDKTLIFFPCLSLSWSLSPWCSLVPLCLFSYLLLLFISLHHCIDHSMSLSQSSLNVPVYQSTVFIFMSVIFFWLPPILSSVCIVHFSGLQICVLCILFVYI